MKVFKIKAFSKWAKGERITDRELKKAVTEMQAGLVDANLGSGVYKKRIAVNSRGKSAGARTLVAFKTGTHIFFIFGFLKNEQDNIDKKELKGLKEFASSLFDLNDDQIASLIKNGSLFEVK
jgi:hypothetical protein